MAASPSTPLRPLGDAQPGDITFVADEKNAPRLHDCRASAAVVPASVSPNGIPIISVKDPLEAFVLIFRHIRGDVADKPHGIDPRAFVHPTAIVGEGASIFPFASVDEGTIIGANCRLHAGAVVGKNCKLGDQVTLHPNAVVYDGCILGHRVTIHANAVIGADGFGYRLHGRQTRQGACFRPRRDWRRRRNRRLHHNRPRHL